MKNFLLIAIVAAGTLTNLAGQTNSPSPADHISASLTESIARGDLETIFAAASGGEKLFMLDQLDKSPSKEISAQLLKWLEKQKFIMVGSENVTVATYLHKRVAAVIAAGVGQEAPARLIAPQDFLQFSQNIHAALSNSEKKTQ